MVTDMATVMAMAMGIKMGNDTIIIIQARVGSSRLPGKMLRPFYEGKTILDLIIENLKRSSYCDQIVLATTSNPIDQPLVEIAKKQNISCFRGSENNVLDRFVECAKKFNATNVIRICADNPFLDMELLNLLLCEASKKDVDYCSYQINGIPAIRTHLGFFCEYVSLRALERVQELTKDVFYLEHVTNYIYSHSDLFKINWLACPELIDNYSEIRLTVDTEEDFEITQSIYTELYLKSSKFSFRDVLNFLENKKEYINIMKKNIERNGK